MGRSSPKLTGKQELFVQGLIKGLSQRQAYIKAGYSSKGKTDNVVDVNASKLFKSTKVSLRYNELMEKHEKKALITRERACEMLLEVYEMGIQDRNLNPLISAVKTLCDLNDLYPKQAKEETQEDKLNKLMDKLDDKL